MKQKIQEIIGTQWVENGRVKKNLMALKEGKCTPCRSKAGNICCNQMKTTAIFKRQQTAKIAVISQYKVYDRIYHLSHGVNNMQPTVCQ